MARVASPTVGTNTEPIKAQAWPDRGSRAGLAVLLAAFVVLGAIYAVVVPLFEVSDELWH